MRAALVLVLLLVAGCKKKAPEASGASLGVGPTGPREAPRVKVVGPVHWYDATGLCLDVPEGWTGLGRGDKGHLLTLEQEETGVVFEILLASAPPDRRDLARVFADEGTYRDVPALGGVGVETWVSDIPGGPTLQVWLGEVNGTPVRLEARYPWGNSFTGKTTIDRLLSAVCVE